MHAFRLKQLAENENDENSKSMKTISGFTITVVLCYGIHETNTTQI